MGEDVAGRCLVSGLLAVAALLTPAVALGNVNPIYARDHVNVFPASSVAASAKGLVVDGDLSDWRPEAFVLLYPSQDLLGTYALRIAFAYDEDALLVAARFTDTSPMSSRVDPRKDPSRGWDGDALQMRVVSTNALGKPFPHAKLQSDLISHMTLWCFSGRDEPALDIRHGMNFHGKQTLIGKESGLAFRRGGEGEDFYAMEGRIRWPLINATGPEPGKSWLFTLQPLWGNAGGKLEHNFFECATGSGLQYQQPDGWGRAEFVTPDLAPQRFAAQAEFLRWRTALEKGGYKAQIADLARQVCGQVDWGRPELTGTAFEKACRDDDFMAAALGLIRHMRARKTPVLEYSKEWVARARADSTPEQREAARTKFIEGDHTDTTYALGPKAEDFMAWARKTMEKRAKWGLGGWGTTRSLTREISKAWPIEECPDEAFIPWFAYLLKQLPAEWRASMKWNESGMANAGHNWWAVTYRGFYQAGLYFPEFKGFERFRALAPTWIEYEAFSLFAPDGFTRERSGYHGVGSDLWNCAKVAKLNGVKFSPEFEGRMRLAREATMKLLTPDGRLPAVGDGFNVYLSPKERPGTHPRLAQCADRYGDQTDTVLPHSGYYMMRENWTTGSDYAMIDAGTRGNGVTSHDMSCVFHVQLHAKGRCILTSQGAGSYKASPARMWRRGEFSHNCATVDGEPSVPYSGVHGFDAVIAPFIEQWLSRPRFAYFSGVHEGYGRKLINVPSTRRKLFYLRGEYWALIDRFTSGDAGAGHTYQLNFQLAAPAKLQDDGSVITSGAGGNLVIVPVPGACGEAKLEPCPFPARGKFNPDRLVYTREKTGHCIFATVLVPFNGGKAPQVSVRLLDVRADERIVSPWEITGLEITIDGRRDVYVDQHMHWNLPWEAGGQKGSGRLSHSRCESLR